MLAARRWGSEQLNASPAVLANAMPKSGSHLIYQVAQGLSQLGPFVNPGFPPVNRDEFNDKLPDDQIVKNLMRLRPGDIAYGYIQSRTPFNSLLTQLGRAMIFVYRDPRDMIISHVFYATQMHTGHGMHAYYTKALGSMEERINAAIEGVEEPGSVLSPIAKKYQGYIGWLDEVSVLCLRFEDLILKREKALGRILDYLESRGYKPYYPRQQQLEILQIAIKPQKSGTFRKGQTGGWHEHFTDANKIHFKDLTGDLLHRLGYESGDAW
ncbi:MAG: hypothetical protein A2Z16_04955 [Chloroflexi bacterium RBG_16_54_18]|nr:MAG: hypothetical protein A2Z16_04955 [Chloroflexi bacterium RBG_16_54_18]